MITTNNTTWKTPKTSDRDARYGYVIVSTPGLITEGSFPVDETGERAAADWPEHEDRDGDGPRGLVAVFETRKLAEDWMARAITPPGKDPACWGGFSVASAFDAAPQQLAYGLCKGMAGFVIPKF